MALFPPPPNMYKAQCQRDRDTIMEQTNSRAAGELAGFQEEVTKAGVLGGIQDIIAISQQPEARIANFVAGGKDKITDTILAKQGGSRVTNTILSQAAPAAAAALGNLSNTVLGALSGGTLDTLNLDDIAEEYTGFGLLTENLAAELQDANASILTREYCEPPPYAIDLSDRGVKLPFLFVVEFEFSKQYKDSMGTLKFPLMVKTCGRPSVNFEYQEVNMYNYRTKILTKASYPPINMTFFEDGSAHVASFYMQYLKAISPISNVQRPHLFEADGQETGLDFSSTHRSKASTVSTQAGSATTPGFHYGASVGALATDPSETGDYINGRHVFQKITIHHLYRDGTHLGTKDNVRKDTFVLMNPRITSITLDDLDMAGGAPNTAAFTIEYDSFYAQTYQSADSAGTVGDTFNLASSTGGGKFPLKAQPVPTTKQDDVEGEPGEEEPSFLEKIGKDITSPFKNTAVGKIVAGVSAGGISTAGSTIAATAGKIAKTFRLDGA